MNIDARARSAADELRAVTAGGVRMATMTEIDRASTNRRRTRSIAAAIAAVVAIAGLGAVALTRSGSATQHGSDPIASVSGSPTSSTATMAICNFSGFTCLGGRTVRADLPVPVEVTLPPAISGDDARTWTAAFEVYVDSHSNAGLSGVTVLEGATPTKAESPSTPDPSAGTTAASVAAWLATRDYVRPTTPVRTTLGGLPAYRVHVALAPVPLVGPMKANQPSASTFSSGESWSAVTVGLHDATYYLVDVPHAGLTVVWSWSFGGSPEDRAAQDAYVRALRFGPN